LDVAAWHNTRDAHDARTHAHARRKSEKSAWDQPPPGFDGANAAQLAQLAMATGGPLLGGLPLGMGALPGALGAMAGVGGGLGLPGGLGGLGQLLPGAMGLVPTAQQTAQQAAQINRQARRLYVGSIPPGVSDVPPPSLTPRAVGL
jgi:hypothetical protein